MNELEDIVLQLQRRKIRFDEGELILTLWNESIEVLQKKGYEEPLLYQDIVKEMQQRGEEVVAVADCLYNEYHKIIDMTFDKSEIDYNVGDEDGRQ